MIKNIIYYINHRDWVQVKSTDPIMVGDVILSTITDYTKKKPPFPSYPSSITVGGIGKVFSNTDSFIKHISCHAKYHSKVTVFRCTLGYKHNPYRKEHFK